MITRVHDDLALWPERLIAGTSYGSAEMLYRLVHEREIEPHIPVFDKSRRTDGTFSRADFAYDQGSDSYDCPAGKQPNPDHRRFATSRYGINQDNTLHYRARQADRRTLQSKVAVLSEGVGPQGDALDRR